MAIRIFWLDVSTTAEINIIDSTSKLEPIAEQAGTGALTTIEYESGAVADLRTALERSAAIFLCSYGFDWNILK